MPTNILFAFAFSVSRIMIPAWALELLVLTIRATTVPSPGKT